MHLIQWWTLTKILSISVRIKDQKNLFTLCKSCPIYFFFFFFFFFYCNCTSVYRVLHKYLYLTCVYVCRLAKYECICVQQIFMNTQVPLCRNKFFALPAHIVLMFTIGECTWFPNRPTNMQHLLRSVACCNIFSLFHNLQDWSAASNPHPFISQFSFFFLFIIIVIYKICVFFFVHHFLFSFLCCMWLDARDGWLIKDNF